MSAKTNSVTVQCILVQILGTENGRSGNNYVVEIHATHQSNDRSKVASIRDR